MMSVLTGLIQYYPQGWRDKLANSHGKRWPGGGHFLITRNISGPCLAQNSSHQWGVCCLELAVQPAGVLCWFKRQVVWPGNESCLYGAAEHKERLSGSGRWPRLGQSSSLSAKHNLSFGRVPDTRSALQPQWATYESRGLWVKLQWMHKWRRILPKNILKDSTVVSDLQFAVRIKGARAQSGQDLKQQITAVIKHKHQQFKVWTLSVSKETN